MAAVLDEDRVDVLYQRYEGGGIDVNAPAIFVRKKVASNTAISAGILTDLVSGASIDVESSGASAYEEQRNETSLGIEFLKDKSIYSVNISQSTENDYDTQSVSASINQDFFGDLSNLSMSASYADSIVKKTGDVSFSETASQYSFSLGLSQILTKKWIMHLSFNKALDEGFLQNPYRFTYFIDPIDPSKRAIQYIEKEADGSYGFPNIRNSEALALKTRYLIMPNHVIYAGMRTFKDSFNIDAINVDIGYNFRYQHRWLFDISLRHYEQSAADFYSDLYDFQNQTNFRSRDKELSTFSNNMLSVSASYDLPPLATWVKKSSVHAYVDYVHFDYENFRDARISDVNAGDEPLYNFSAYLFRLMYSLWF